MFRSNLYIIMDTFIERFQIGRGHNILAVGHVANPKPYTGQEYPTNTDVYFTPANFETDKPVKEGVLGTLFLWVDVDNPELPPCTLVPTYIVSSGHGWHLYWQLKTIVQDADTIEELNKILIQDVAGADPGSWNVNRYLRVPGTINTKKPVAECTLSQENGHVYTADDVQVLKRLHSKDRHKIRTGDRRGFRSRSERDWATIQALIKAGATDALITHIFETCAIGDKHRDKKTNTKYLPYTLIQARKQTVVEPVGSIIEKADGYHIVQSKGTRHISTFIIEPKILLDGSRYDEGDAIAGTVHAEGYEWPNICFTRDAFTTVRQMDRQCPILAWQWLGSDNDIRKLSPYLLAVLKDKGLPKVHATPFLGLIQRKETWYCVANDHVLGEEDVWDGYDGPVAWLPSKKEAPKLNIRPSNDPTVVGELLPQLNEDEVIWPMIGWYTASAAKPWLESKGYRYPILNVTGTKGSGKTTLIQRAFLPLMGHAEPRSYDAGTTTFVTLCLMGSSTSVPVSFSEFRYENVERFIRFILLAYDTGHNPRGRPDQTVEDYPLSAPFSVDGEDLIADPAARERIIVARLRASTVREGGDEYKAFQKFRQLDLTGMAGTIIQRTLKMLNDGTADALLKEAYEGVHTAFPIVMPDRIRNNHIVAMFGILLWSKIVDTPPPSPNVLLGSIEAVFNTASQRSRLSVDDFIEDIVNTAAAGRDWFKWRCDDIDNLFHFQMATAHSWWLTTRRRQGRTALERDAIKGQLKDVEYIRDPIVIDGTWMYSISLKEARGCGLDIPDNIKSNEIRISL